GRCIVVVDGHGDGRGALVGVGVAPLDGEDPASDRDRPRAGAAVAPVNVGRVVGQALGPAGAGEGRHRLAGRGGALHGAEGEAAGGGHGGVGDGGGGRGGGVRCGVVVDGRGDGPGALLGVGVAPLHREDAVAERDRPGAAAAVAPV